MQPKTCHTIQTRASQYKPSFCVSTAPKVIGILLVVNLSVLVQTKTTLTNLDLVWKQGKSSAMSAALVHLVRRFCSYPQYIQYRPREKSIAEPPSHFLPFFFPFSGTAVDSSRRNPPFTKASRPTSLISRKRAGPK